MAVVKLLMCLSFLHMALAKGSEAQIECTQEVMKVTVPMDGDRRISYLDQLKDYEPCQPVLENNMAVYMLDLQDYYKCGVTRVINKMNEKRTYYHKVIIEGTSGRETVLVRCMVSPKARVLNKRQTQPFPLDFNEPDVLNITRNEVGHAPEPMLSAIVKKNGVPVPRNDSVSPGTHLTMEIFLDSESAPVYGLLVSYMYATNTDQQQETIILNGCSLDSTLFNNFGTTDGDLLVAKFRAFKFPDTNYVMFVGTVNVCLDKCDGVQCSTGTVGYGRRRRAINSETSQNRVYEVSLSTFLKVDWKEGELDPEDVKGLITFKNPKAANQLLDDKNTSESTIIEKVQESKLVLLSEETVPGKSAAFTYSCLLLVSSLVLALYN